MMMMMKILVLRGSMMFIYNGQLLYKCGQMLSLVGQFASQIGQHLGQTYVHVQKKSAYRNVYKGTNFMSMTILLSIYNVNVQLIKKGSVKSSSEDRN
jgi:hypothetical protein